MATWAEFEREAPAFAARVKERLDAGVNKTLATLRQDGSPRISGTELEFRDGALGLGMMAGSLKLRDVRRDPRVAIHGPTIDPPKDGGDWSGEAKLAGRLVEVDRTEAEHPGAGFFELDLTEAVVTAVEGQLLIVESWHPGRGYERRTRT